MEVGLLDCLGIPDDLRIHMDLSPGRLRAGLPDTGEAGCSQRVGALLHVLVGP